MKTGKYHLEVSGINLDFFYILVYSKVKEILCSFHKLSQMFNRNYPFAGRNLSLLAGLAVGSRFALVGYLLPKANLLGWLVPSGRYRPALPAFGGFGGQVTGHSMLGRAPLRSNSIDTCDTCGLASLVAEGDGDRKDPLCPQVGGIEGPEVYTTAILCNSNEAQE
jgi:hypothetical protein